MKQKRIIGRSSPPRVPISRYNNRGQESRLKKKKKKKKSSTLSCTSTKWCAHRTLRRVDGNTHPQRPATARTLSLLDPSRFSHLTITISGHESLWTSLQSRGLSVDRIANIAYSAVFRTRRKR
ncbi:hypothetical protein ACS0PU_009801 [Formica fusca]